MTKLIFATILFLVSIVVGFPQDKVKSEDLVISNNFLNTQRKDLNGKTFKIGERNKKYKILLVWAIWSGPCKVVLEEFSKISQEFDKYNVEIFGLIPVEKESQNKNLRDAKKLTKRFKTKFSNLLISEEIIEREVMLPLKVNAVPLLILIDQKGRLLKHHIGSNYRHIERLKSELEELSTTNK